MRATIHILSRFARGTLSVVEETLAAGSDHTVEKLLFDARGALFEVIENLEREEIKLTPAEIERCADGLLVLIKQCEILRVGLNVSRKEH